MQSINFSILIPVSLILIQSFILLSATFYLFRKIKLLPNPIAGMEYSGVITAAGLMLGIMIISISDVNALMQSYKIFSNQNTGIFRNSFSKFCQFFLVVLIVELLFLLIAYLLTRLIFGFNRPIAEIEKENIPAAIIFSALMVGFSIILRVISSEIIELMVPQYVNIL